MASLDAWSLTSSDFDIIEDECLKTLGKKLHAAFKVLRVRLTSRMDRFPHQATEIGAIRSKLDVAHQEIRKLVLGHEDFTQNAIQWSLNEIAAVLRSCEEDIHKKILHDDPLCPCRK